MIIAPESVVTLRYTLREAKGEKKVIEELTAESPMAFIFGVQPFLPNFEAGIVGKKQGDTFEFEIESADAYGSKSDDQLADLPLENFMVDGVLQKDLLEAGKELSMRGQDGSVMRAMILEVGEETVKMDFNHPLADVDLHFSGEILEVRGATVEELDHGHVHGPGGHEH